MTRVLQQDIEYVDVRSNADRREPTNFYEKWVDQSSAKHANPELIAADALRRLYPGYSLVVSEDYRLSNLLTLPGIVIHPSDSQEAEQVSSVTFVPTLARIEGKVTGSLVDYPIIGSHKLTWNNNDFVVYITKFQNGNFLQTAYFLLHDGPEQQARDLVLAVCLYAEQAHDEVWVFDMGYWSKDKQLWLGIKDSSWNDIIMKEESKIALQKDIYGFFKSESTYKKSSIPWKRGLIMYGPPGNGKTITIKAVMKTCTERGFIPLYVKSFRDPRGEEVAIQNIFLKTRQLAPCVLILEDLDSLINNQNRSFFLNQLDGLEGNDGLLVIASTNHFDRLDPGLSSRPSRFDRKYLFDDPDYQERVLYVKYWQEKLKGNTEITFPESLVEEVANLTQGFSFAYLKEAFVSTLVQFTNADEDEHVEFSLMLKSQIMALRKELGEQTSAHTVARTPTARPERELDEQRPSLITYQDPFSPKSPIYGPALPINVSPTGISVDAVPLQMAQVIRKRSANRSTTSGSEVVSREESTVRSSAPLPQGCILHAPPSAYPQVMPGSLPSMRLEALQGPIRPTWRVAGASASTSTSGAEASRKNPFSPVNSRLI